MKEKPMIHCFQNVKPLSAALAAGSLAFFGLLGIPAAAQIATPPLVPMAVAPKALVAHPFEESVYLYNKSYDTDLDNPGYASGNWGTYKAWLGAPSLGAEADPGWGNWYDCAQHTSWNRPWGTMQQRYGAALPTVLLGMGQMPFGSLNGSALAYEDQQWQLEAAGDPATMAYFASYAQDVDNGSGGYAPFQKVIIRLGYEFDGFWNPFGSLNQISNMPNNYVAAWRNIVTTMRANDPKHLIKFCWNPTDNNVRITSFDYYPGDAYVDYIGFDSYDADYSGIYQQGVQPDAATQQRAWTNSIRPRIQRFADFASAGNTSRRGFIAGRSVPIVVGEWGLWQIADPAHPAGADRPAGGDDPTYIQNMYDWMSDPANNVAVECYFESPADGDSSLSGIFHPTAYPKSAALFKQLFGSGSPAPSAVPLGHRIGIKSSASGYFVSSDLGDSTFLKALWSTSPGAWEVFDVTDAGSGSIALKCEQTGNYVTADFNQGDNGLLRADWAQTIGGWEKFQWADQGSGIFGLKAANGLYVSCNLNSGDRLQAAWAQTIGSWEQFTWSDQGTFGAAAFTAGFEGGDLSAWTLWTGTNGAAAFAQNCGTAAAHGGSWEYTNWSSSPYELTLYKNVAVANGPHTVSAWIKSSGGQPVCQMEVTTNGVKTVVPITASAGWVQVSATVSVSTGVVEVGFYSKASGNQWLNVDDVVLQ